MSFTNKRQSDSELYVHETFYSIQGEGPSAGRPALFVRLQGCNLRCPWCDEPDSLDMRGTTLEMHKMDIDKLVARTAQAVKDCGLLVVTGGEPTTQLRGLLKYLDKLESALTGSEFEVEIETNGTAPGVLKPVLEELEQHARIIVSPKNIEGVPGGKSRDPSDEMLSRAYCIKLVVDKHTDIEAEFWKYRPTIAIAASSRLRHGAWFYLQPEDSCRKEVLDKCVHFVLEHPFEARLSMRLHKELNLK